MSSNLSELGSYISAGYPVLYVQTYEEERAEREIVALAERRELKVSLWSASSGLHSAEVDPNGERQQPIAALEALLSDDSNEGTVFIFRDLHPYFQSPQVCRLVRDVARAFKANSHTLVLISPVLKLPPELDRDITVIELDLPGRDSLGAIFDRLVAEVDLPELRKDLNEDERDRIIEAAKGLTTIEAENVFSKALVAHCEAGNDAAPVSQLVMCEKAAAVRKTGILEYHEARETEGDVGGLGNLKGWLKLRKHAFGRKAREYGLPSPKGVLLVGLPGCGKSLVAKAAASVLGLPLIRFDLSRVYQGLVGASEQNVRSSLKAIDAIGRCVVWIDEMEKAMAGMGGSGTTDSGVSPPPVRARHVPTAAGSAAGDRRELRFSGHARQLSGDHPAAGSRLRTGIQGDPRPGHPRRQTPTRADHVGRRGRPGAAGNHQG